MSKLGLGKKMSRRNDDLVAQFASVTGADTETSLMFLETYAWDLAKATAEFFESGAAATLLAAKESAPVPTLASPNAALKVGLELDAQQFGNVLQRELSRYVEVPLFSDVVLTVHGEKIPAHKFVLSAWSAVWRKQLMEDEEREELEVTLPAGEKTVPIFKQLLRFLYTGITELSSDTALPLLEMAHTFEVDVLKTKCGEFLFLHDEKKDLGRLLELADAFDCKALEVRCASHIAEQFDQCLRDDSLMTLKISTWEELLKNNSIKVSREEEVFRSVLRYANKQEKRVATLQRLLPLIRFGQLSNRFLVEEVEFNEELKDLPFVHDLVHEAYRWKLYQKPVGEHSLLRTQARATTQLRWDAEHASPTIELSEDRATAACKLPPTKRSAWSTVLADRWVSSGVHTWDIAIVSNSSDWIFLGVVGRDYTGWTDSVAGYIGHYKDSWAFGSKQGWGKTHNQQNSNYGTSFKTGSVVSIHLDMEKRTLSFSVDGTDHGICHRGLPSEVCPAVTLYRAGDKVSIFDRSA
ncbi:BTB/POZ domain-containing protein 9 [Balamuthia mandrillaris]